MKHDSIVFSVLTRDGLRARKVGMYGVGLRAVQLANTEPPKPRNFNRGGRIRTGDLLLPKQARYRAAPRPAVMCDIIHKIAQFQNAW